MGPIATLKKRKRKGNISLKEGPYRKRSVQAQAAGRAIAWHSCWEVSLHRTPWGTSVDSPVGDVKLEVHRQWGYGLS